MSELGPATPLLIPNIAAEEGAAVWNAAGGETQVRSVARLWRLLFGPSAHLVDDAEAFEALWPGGLGPAPFGPVYEDLDRGQAFAWLHTPEARRLAKDLGYDLAGPDPDAVAKVHDKAFALRWSKQAGEEPEALRPLITIFEAEVLRGATGDVMQQVQSEVANWPSWTGGRFTLKPRFGSSGRGRVSGRVGSGSSHDLASLPGALPRLAERGGAVLEPWLDRVRDLSAQLWVEPGGRVRLLGTVELLVSASGLYRGHRGSVDNTGRVTSLCPEDEQLREVAAQLAVAASAVGFSGPCGVDAFSFRGPAGEHLFRPVVEFNGRFTMGTIAIGLLRRALPVLRRELPRDASERRAFFFSLSPPPEGWPRPHPPGCLMISLEPAAGASPPPGLLVAQDPGYLEMAFQGRESPPMLGAH